MIPTNKPGSAARILLIIPFLMIMFSMVCFAKKPAKKAGQENSKNIPDSAICSNPDKMPTFMGEDLIVFKTWVQNNLSYPLHAAENGIMGSVEVSFVVREDGSLSNIKVKRSPDMSLTNEVMRVIMLSPNWEPGLKDSIPVNVQQSIVADFKVSAAY